MNYRLEFTKEVQRALRKMDRHQATLIIRWLYLHVDGIEDPRSMGKGLAANRAGQRRYRIGNYRVICEIQDEQLIAYRRNGYAR